jgi:hypothetical protein
MQCNAGRKQDNMHSQEPHDFRLNKYHKLNIMVVLIILSILLAVFLWYERSLERIDDEMTKQKIGERQNIPSISCKKPV